MSGTKIGIKVTGELLDNDYLTSTGVHNASSSSALHAKYVHTLKSRTVLQ